LISGDLEVRREVAQIVDHRRLPLPRGTSPRPMAGPQGGELVVVALQVPDALGHDSTPGCPVPAGPAPAEPEKGRKKGAPEAPQVYSAAAATRGQAPPPPVPARRRAARPAGARISSSSDARWSAVCAARIRRRAASPVARRSSGC